MGIKLIRILKKGALNMFKKVISSIGFGNVTIDTKLNDDTFHPGDTASGVVEINGGIYEKKINGIILTLLTKYEADKEDSDFSYHEKVVSEHNITSDLIIPPKKQISLPFTLQIPSGQPLSDEQTETVLRTKLLVSQAVDPVDEDTIIIH